MLRPGMAPIQQPTRQVVGMTPEALVDQFAMFVQSIESGQFTKDQSVLVALILNQIVVAGHSIQMLLASLK